MKAAIRAIQPTIGRPEHVHGATDIDRPQDEPDRGDRDRRADDGAEQARAIPSPGQVAGGTWSDARAVSLAERRRPARWSR